MIVATESLPEYSGVVAMVDGGFDPIHAGHIDYFQAASELGVPVLCNVSSDAYVSTKHPPLLPEEQRVRVIDSIRYIDFTHLSRSSTEDVLELLAPRYYVKGADWRDRLPERQVELCRLNGTEIVYLDTVTQSSTRLLAKYHSRRGA